MNLTDSYTIGDNVSLLQHVPENSIDMIYMDPPYCTGRDFYHFSDKFRSTTEYREQFIRPIILSCHRVLNSVGNIVIHVEPKISHHIRFVLDDIFGEKNFRNEIVWVSGGNHTSTQQLQRNHDVLIVYRKSKNSTYNPEYRPYDEDSVKRAPVCDVTGKQYSTSALVNRQPHITPRPNLRYEWNGHMEQWYVTKTKMQSLHDSGQLYYSSSTSIPRIKKYFVDMKGVPVKDVWTDIKQIQGVEKLDYATQKPILLLNRIVQMFSRPESLVLDPCAGSGTLGRSAIATQRHYILFDVNPEGKRIFEQSLAVGKSPIPPNPSLF